MKYEEYLKQYGDFTLRIIAAHYVNKGVHTWKQTTLEDLEKIKISLEEAEASGKNYLMTSEFSYNICKACYDLAHEEDQNVAKRIIGEYYCRSIVR